MARAGSVLLRNRICSLIVLMAVLCPPFTRTVPAAEREDIEHYKMLSTVEYSGQTQFRNQVDTLMTVKRQFLSDDRVQYSITSRDFGLAAANAGTEQQPSSTEVSFIVDKSSGKLSGGGEDLAFLRNINNNCAKSLQQVTKQNIGKTWKQSFDLKGYDASLPDELKFTLTAMQLQTKTLGEMIAVRALSEPFAFKVVTAKEGTKEVISRIKAVYLFDSEIKDIYVSITVFEASGNITGSNENLRYEIATYKTDTSGAAVDLEGLGPKFESFVRKVGLTGKSLKVEKESLPPRWTHAEGLRAAQASSLCAAIACEGAPNPVSTIWVPAARTVALQSSGQLSSMGQVTSVSSMLTKSIPGMGSMKIAIAPAFMGVGAGTAGAIAAGGGAAVAIAGGGGGGGGSDARSPATP